jgi:hypothetical protein
VRQTRRRSLPVTSNAVGARNLRRVGSGATCAPRSLSRTGKRTARQNGRSGPGHTLEQREVHGRMLPELNGSGSPGIAEKPRRPTSREEKVKEDSPTNRAIPRSRQDSEGPVNCKRGRVRHGDVTSATRAGLRTLEGESDAPLATPGNRLAPQQVNILIARSEATATAP